MDIGRHYCIKLEQAKSLLLCSFHAVLYQPLSNVKPSAVRAYPIAGIADMTAAPHIIRMQNI